MKRKQVGLFTVLLLVALALWLAGPDGDERTNHTYKPLDQESIPPLVK